MLARCRKLNLTRLGLKSDVSDAHRTFKVHRKDHGFQACMLEEVLIINQVGTTVQPHIKTCALTNG